MYAVSAKYEQESCTTTTAELANMKANDEDAFVHKMINMVKDTLLAKGVSEHDTDEELTELGINPPEEWILCLDVIAKLAESVVDD